MSLSAERSKVINGNLIEEYYWHGEFIVYINHYRYWGTFEEAVKEYEERYLGGGNAGMWIRSQDKKKLIDCSDIRMSSHKNSCRIYDRNADEFLGTYKTKERALEVLNKIHNFINEQIDFERQCQYSGPYIKDVPNTFVFEMPEK